MKSPLKWVGGKAKLAPHLAGSIAAELDASGGDYIEPFLGGASVALALGPRPMILADANEELINFWQTIRENPSFWPVFQTMMADPSSEAYYEMRAADVSTWTSCHRAARFLYLNRLARSGIWRENKSGGMNVPYAKEVKLPKDLKARLRSAAKTLGEAKIVREDFRKVIRAAGPGDVIYADPPYDGGFAAYTAAGFGKQDQIDLASALRAATRRGVSIWTSNANTDLVRELYSWAEIGPVEEWRPVNRDTKNRGAIECVLIYADGEMPDAPSP